MRSPILMKMLLQRRKHFFQNTLFHHHIFKFSKIETFLYFSQKLHNYGPKHISCEPFDAHFTKSIAIIDDFEKKSSFSLWKKNKFRSFWENSLFSSHFTANVQQFGEKKTHRQKGERTSLTQLPNNRLKHVFLEKFLFHNFVTWRKLINIQVLKFDDIQD